MKNSQTNHKGTDHFILQRTSAFIMVPLVIWLIYNIFVFANKLELLPLFIASPINFALILILLISFFVHAYIGVNEVIKDYVHCQVIKSILQKTMLAVLVFTYIVSVVNLLFYHCVFRFFSG